MKINRRQYLSTVASTALVALAHHNSSFADETDEYKSVAAVVTKYAPGLHADVIVGKVLEGWKQDGGPGPKLRLASMYVDQISPDDLGQQLAKKYDIPVFKTIEGALTLGQDAIKVDGVLSIGEHGEYPWNEKGQHLYPRRRFFTEIAAAMEKYGRVVPVFSDKHLGPQWEDALWIYQRAQELKIPLMAGSSLPVSYRSPDATIPMDCEIESAIGIGYSGLDIYGIHTLELYQTFVERRRGAEAGVKWVQSFRGDKILKAKEDFGVSNDLLRSALNAVSAPVNDELLIAINDHSALFVFEYHDGLLGSIFMLPDFAQGCGIAVQLKENRLPVATRAEERPVPKYPHFAFLLHAIERMIHTGKPTYPVERTLLTTGILDRALTSLHEDSARLDTPELAIRYTPVDYPHAPNPPLYG